MRLTEKKIQSIISTSAFDDKPYKLADGGGLYLLVLPSSVMLWRFRYQFGNKEKLLSIGPYSMIKLAEARQKAFEAKKLLREGIDPSQRKQENKRQHDLEHKHTFRAVAQDWHNTNKKKWTPEHAARLWMRLENHAMTELGPQPISKIRTPDLIVLLRKLEKKGKNDTAGRLAQILNVVFRYAVHSGLIEHSPASDLRGVVAPHQEKHFPAIPPAELPELLVRLEGAKTHPQNILAIKLLLHTFLRPGELRYGRWAEIDWEAKLWQVPANRMKRRIEHAVPLSEPVIALLRELQAYSGSGEYLFPNHHRRTHPVMSENTVNKVLRSIGYGDRLVGHGFRAIASTALNESALFRPDVIEAQLSHIEQNNSRRPYNRAQYLEERRSMMEWWSEYINQAKERNYATPHIAAA